MAHWASGYVTDIEYVDGFYRAQTPGHMALAAALNGIEAPDLGKGFTYCDLGCGRGGTSLVLAALNPNSEFHAIDFHPAHIAHATAQSQAAGLKNVVFHECSFDELGKPGAPALPRFDFVAMHGVWSWVAAEQQAAIVAFLAAKLKPGGLVYASYNTLPGWATTQPLQRLLREIATAAGGRSDRAIVAAVETLAALADAKIIPASLQEGVARLRGTTLRSSLAYLAHEYLNESWRPVYHADVARAFAEARLTYAAAAELMTNFVDMTLNAEQQALVAQVETPELRETLKDYCSERRFRQDVFVCGPRRMSGQTRDGVLGRMRLALRVPDAEAVQINKPDGTVWQADPTVYKAVFDSLRTGPKTIADLLTSPGIPPGHGVRPAELAGALVGTELASPWHEPSAAERAGADRLNALIERQGEIGLAQTATIAVPSLGSAIGLTAGNFDLYMALKRGGTPDAEALAARFVVRCRAAGGHPVIDGQPIADEAQAKAMTTRDYAQKIERLVPLWRMMGVV